jgi:cysteine desulfurase
MFWKKERTYLDVAAGVSGNPSSPHEEGRRAKQMLEDARTSIARLVEVQPDDVIFTSGATEANALAILGIAKEGVHMLYLPSAHASIVENMKLLAEEGVEIEALPIQNYRVDTAVLAKMLRPETVLVSMDAVCGETGVVWNTREVAEVLRQHGRRNTFLASSGLIGMSQPVASKSVSAPVLHVDASQAVFTEKLTRAHFGADILTLDASKVCDTRGIGALIAHRTIPLMPLYKGGGQERGLRAGSEAPELAEKFAVCLRQAALNRESFHVSAERARAELIEAITSSIPNVCINEGHVQAPNILNLSLPGRDTDYLVALLDEAGFAVSTRSACETNLRTGSRAVYELTGDQGRARATLRISWGPLTTSHELARFAKELVKAAAFSAGGIAASGGIDNSSHG